MTKLALHWKILIGMGLGAAVGLIVNLSQDLVSASVGEESLGMQIEWSGAGRAARASLNRP